MAGTIWVVAHRVGVVWAALIAMYSFCVHGVWEKATVADWLSGGGTLLAAWIAVGIFLARRSEQHAQRRYSAWVQSLEILPYLPELKADLKAAYQTGLDALSANRAPSDWACEFKSAAAIGAALKENEAFDRKTESALRALSTVSVSVKQTLRSLQFPEIPAGMHAASNGMALGGIENWMLLVDDTYADLLGMQAAGRK